MCIGQNFYIGAYWYICIYFFTLLYFFCLSYDIKKLWKVMNIKLWESE